jgi:hypothetical protein
MLFENANSLGADFSWRKVQWMHAALSPGALSCIQLATLKFSPPTHAVHDDEQAPKSVAHDANKSQTSEKGKYSLIVALFVIATIRRLSACTRAYTCTIWDFLPSRKHDIVRGQRHLLSHAVVPHRHCVFINAARKWMSVWEWQRYAFIIFLINAISHSPRCSHAFMSAIWCKCKCATTGDKRRGKEKYLHTPNNSYFHSLVFNLIKGVWTNI